MPMIFTIARTALMQAFGVIIMLKGGESVEPVLNKLIIIGINFQ
jgi:hypothetical protein